MTAKVAPTLSAVLVLFALACASHPSSTSAPNVALIQTSQMPTYGLDPRSNIPITSAADPRSGIPMTYRLEFENPFEFPVTLVSVEVESVGDSGAYALKRVRHGFNRVIPAKSKDAIEFRAWVHRLQIDTRGQSNSPVSLRGTVRFKGKAGAMSRNFVARGQ